MSGDSRRQGLRLRQAVLVARELGPVVDRLREELQLGEPFSDPAVEYFGLLNAVFALGDTFLEVVSPIRDGTAAGRLLDSRGGDGGYMLMFEVEDLPQARERARASAVREVFEIELDDMSEVHLHPADMRGAIVSLSAPRPPGSWRWGGPGWERRSAQGSVAGARVAVAEHDAVARRWSHVLGGSGTVEFAGDDGEPGLVEVLISGRAARSPVSIAGVRFAFAPGRPGHLR